MKNLTLSVLTIALGFFLLQSCATDSNSSANSDSSNAITPAQNATTPAANTTTTTTTEPTKATAKPATPAAKPISKANTLRDQKVQTTPALQKKELSKKKVDLTRKLDAKSLKLDRNAINKRTANPKLTKNIVEAYKKRGSALATAFCACSKKPDAAACKTKLGERVEKMRGLLKDANLEAFETTYAAGTKACK